MPELTTVTPPSPTMVGMPPEVLLNVFEWASRDDGLLDNMPSWRHYTLSNPDPNNPWYTPSMEAYNTIHAIAQVCSRWKTLASQFYLRHVVARTNSEVEAYLSQLKASADLRHWVKRLTLAIVVEDVQWTRRDTDRICKLMELCTDLEVFGNGIIALNGETHNAATPILAELFTKCTALRRVHWKPVGCMQLRPFAWSTLLGEAKNLAALHVDCPTLSLPQHEDPPANMPRLRLPALHTLSLRIDATHAWLAKEIAPWDLPQLRHLYLQSDPHVNTIALTELLEAHGLGLNTIAMCPAICAAIPPSLVLPLCGESLQEMLIPDFITPFEKRHQTVKTAICIRSADVSRPRLEPFLAMIKWVDAPNEFPAVKRIVIVDTPSEKFVQEGLSWEQEDGRLKAASVSSQ